MSEINDSKKLILLIVGERAQIGYYQSIFPNYSIMHTFTAEHAIRIIKKEKPILVITLDNGIREELINRDIDEYKIVEENNLDILDTDSEKVGLLRAMREQLTLDVQTGINICIEAIVIFS